VGLDGHTVIGYEITFKVGKFEINSTASKLNGTFVIRESDEALDQTLLTPLGTFFQHRDKVTDDWYDIAKQDVGGIMSQQIYSQETLLLTNTGIEGRRHEEMDIGNPYISSASRVYHFDTDEPVAPNEYTNILDQYGNTDLTVTLSAGGVALEMGEKDGEEYRPAIQVKAPYAEVGKSLCGQFALEHSLGNGNTWTVDLWFQYTWAEGQEVLKVETDRADISIANTLAEPNYNEPQESEPPYNTESEEEGVEILPYNVARGSGCSLIYAHGGITEIYPIDDEGLHIDSGEWVHAALINNSENVTVLLSTDRLVAEYQAEERANPYIDRTFTGAGTGGDFTFNSSKGTIMVDELMIDTTTAEGTSSFSLSSIQKIPWGALNASTNRFMLVKDPNSEFVSNLNFAPFLELTDADFEEIK
jgi:hypothetical protein